jgi:hypothetical protein
MRGKYLSVFGDYAESIYAYMEKMANRGYLQYTKSSPNTRKVFKRIRRIREKNHTYMEKTQRDSWRILLIRQKT